MTPWSASLGDWRRSSSNAAGRGSALTGGTVGATFNPAWRNDEVRALYDLALGYFEREITAHVAKWDEQRRIDREVWHKAGKLGILLCSVPTEYGGGGGTFAHDIAVFDAQGYSGDLALGIAVHSGIVPHYLLRYGSE